MTPILAIMVGPVPLFATRISASIAASREGIVIVQPPRITAGPPRFIGPELAQIAHKPIELVQK